MDLLTVGSLFTGIGGIDLGLQRAGMEIKWQVEIDDYCTKVLEKHWPDVRRYRDVRELPGSSLEAVDVICGGFPCQPVSLAGQREGQGDPRWLWPHFARLVDEIRPRYVIVENVPGLYSLGGAEVVTDLASLGYDAEWHSIPASAFGAPHKRERFILVADSSRFGSYEPTIRQGPFWGEGTLRTGLGPFGAFWAVEPNVGRVAHGIPRRVDRLRGLGNAVVPQIFEWSGGQIITWSD